VIGYNGGVGGKLPGERLTRLFARLGLPIWDPGSVMGILRGSVFLVFLAFFVVAFPINIAHGDGRRAGADVFGAGVMTLGLTYFRRGYRRHRLQVEYEIDGESEDSAAPGPYRAERTYGESAEDVWTALQQTITNQSDRYIVATTDAEHRWLTFVTKPSAWSFGLKLTAQVLAGHDDSRVEVTVRPALRSTRIRRSAQEKEASRRVLDYVDGRARINRRF
jgi:hypothetical protein